MRRYLSASVGLMTAILVVVAFASAAPYVPREEAPRGVLPADEPQVKGKEPGQEKGWEIDSYANPIRAYGPENIHLYLGDRTAPYMEHGFAKLTHGVYRPGLNDKPAVIVDAYEMQTPLGAYGIFTAERVPSDKMIEVGAGTAHLNARECLLWKGNVFVRIKLIGEVENGEDVLTMLAKKTAANIVGALSIPEVAWFPAGKRAAAGDRYVVRELLGYACLGRGFSVEYDLDGSKATMFLAVIPPGTVVKQGDATKALSAETSYLELRTALIKDGSTPAVLPGPWDSGYRATDPKLGRGLVARSGNYVMGLFGAPDEKTAVEMVSQLVKSLK